MLKPQLILQTKREGFTLATVKTVEVSIDLDSLIKLIEKKYPYNGRKTDEKEEVKALTSKLYYLVAKGLWRRIAVVNQSGISFPSQEFKGLKDYFDGFGKRFITVATHEDTPLLPNKTKANKALAKEISDLCYGIAHDEKIISAITIQKIANQIKGEETPLIKFLNMLLANDADVVGAIKSKVAQKMSNNQGTQNEFAFRVLLTFLGEKAEDLSTTPGKLKILDYVNKYRLDNKPWFHGDDIDDKSAKTFTEFLQKIQKNGEFDKTINGMKIAGYSMKNFRGASLLTLSGLLSAESRKAGELNTLSALQAEKDFYQSPDDFIQSLNGRKVPLLEGDPETNYDTGLLEKNGELVLWQGKLNEAIEKRKMTQFFPPQHTAMKLFADPKRNPTKGIYTPASDLPQEVAEKIIENFINHHMTRAGGKTSLFIIVDDEDIFVITPPELKVLLLEFYSFAASSRYYSEDHREILEKAFNIDVSKGALTLKWKDNNQLKNLLQKTAFSFKFSEHTKELSNILGADYSK